MTATDVVRRRAVLQAFASATGVAALLAACGGPSASAPAAGTVGAAGAAPAPTTATGQAAEPTAPTIVGATTLVYWTFMPTAARFSGRPALFAQFEQQNKAKISITDVDFPQMSPKMLAAAAARQVPDIADPAITMSAIAWGKAGIASDMSTTLKALGQNDFYQSFLQDITCGGKMYGVPYMAYPHILWYRKDLFDQNGLKPPATHDDWLLAAAKLTGTSPDTKKPIYGIGGFLSAVHAHAFWQNLIGPNNGIAFDRNWKVVIDTTPQNLHSMDFMLKLSKYFQPGAVNANYGDTGNLL